MIFVDTGAWYARYVVEDIDHPAAVAWFNAPPDRLVTSDYGTKVGASQIALVEP